MLDTVVVVMYGFIVLLLSCQSRSPAHVGQADVQP
jgi:hypothetical protein